MGTFANILQQYQDPQQVDIARKQALFGISHIRKIDNIIVYAGNIESKDGSIVRNDKLLFYDQLQNLKKGEPIDIILETPGGLAEVVDEFVRQLRNLFTTVNIIIPGCAYSAGTIFAMSADEILMNNFSTLGPIDAQVQFNGRMMSADSILTGFDAIKKECSAAGLNPAYVPVLQSLNPGILQEMQYAQDFSKNLVKDWLIKYKFKNWTSHSSTNIPVTDQDKADRAEEIATKLSSHGEWYSHSRSIKIDDLTKMKLKITDYSKDPVLENAIFTYYVLMKRTFEFNKVSKIIETKMSTIQFSENLPQPAPVKRVNNPQTGIPKPQAASPVEKNVNKQSVPEAVKSLFDQDKVEVFANCTNCHKNVKFEAHFKKDLPYTPGNIKIPLDNAKISCPYCKHELRLQGMREAIENMSGKKIVE